MAAARCVRAACVVFLVYMAYLARPGTSLFSWHPFLMPLAFTGLMMEAAAMFTKHGLGSGRPHTTKVTAHWVLVAAAAAAHGLGYAAIYYTKEANGKPHLTTWHGLIGFITSIFLWTQLTVGGFAKYPKLLERFVSLRRLRSGHSLFGSVTVALGMVTVSLALWSVWFQSNAPAWTLYPALALHLLLLGMVGKRHVGRYGWTGR